MSKQGLGHIPVKPARVPPDEAAEVTYVPRNKLSIGQAYAIESRNIGIGIWDGRSFHGIRFKMGKLFIDSELHYDLDPKYGTAKALRKLE